MTYLYSVFGERLYALIFPAELVMTLLHVASLFNRIPMGRKFSKPLVRFNFEVELLSLHLCFWCLDYGWWITWFVMGPHYVFHILSNWGTVTIKVDDFSQPFEGFKETARKIVLPWDSTCHILNIYFLSQMLGIWKTTGLSMLVLAFFYFFPKEAIYAKPLEAEKQEFVVKKVA
jgi:hypothetical protein